MFKKILLSLTGMFMAAFGISAHAAVDIAAVLLGITDAGTAILSVIAALLVLSTSIFGIVKVYKFVSSKAGA